MMTWWHNIIRWPLLKIYIFIVILLASTNLSITAPFIAGLRLGPSWAVAVSIFSWSFRPISRSEEGRIGLFPGHPNSSIGLAGGWGSRSLMILMIFGGVGGPKFGKTWWCNTWTFPYDNMIKSLRLFYTHIWNQLQNQIWRLQLFTNLHYMISW